VTRRSLTARFRDPGGNVIGLYQTRALSFRPCRTTEPNGPIKPCSADHWQGSCQIFGRAGQLYQIYRGAVASIPGSCSSSCGPRLWELWKTLIIIALTKIRYVFVRCLRRMRMKRNLKRASRSSNKPLGWYCLATSICSDLYLKQFQYRKEARKRKLSASLCTRMVKFGRRRSNVLTALSLFKECEEPRFQKPIDYSASPWRKSGLIHWTLWSPALYGFVTICRFLQKLSLLKGPGQGLGVFTKANQENEEEK